MWSGRAGRLASETLIVNPDQVSKTDAVVQGFRLNTPHVLRCVLAGRFGSATERRAAERVRLLGIPACRRSSGPSISSLQMSVSDSVGQPYQIAITGTVSEPSITRPKRQTNNARLSHLCIPAHVDVVPTGNAGLVALIHFGIGHDRPFLGPTSRRRLPG